MANTEHMSDEVMASLLGTNVRSTNGIMGRSEQRPAATVVRRSTRSTDAAKQQRDKPAMQEKAIIGDVMERVPTRTAVQTTNRKASKFAFERQGFPSLSRPVGSLVKGDALPKQSQPFFTPNKTNTPTDPNPTQLREITERDASAMLEKMNTLEIRESVQELEATLSPEMLAFLKNRKKLKGEMDIKTSIATVQHLPKIVHTPTTDDEVHEKERIAQVLTSIQTLDDLDKAYETEMGIDQESDNYNTGDDWTQACNLLRSTSMRQSLWAAKTVCQKLEMDLNNKKTCRIGESEAEQPYPNLLPVSLRCLLDNYTSTGGILQTYVLRSIYALLQLRAPSDHAIDVTLSNRTSNIIYQEYFLDDTVPTQPFGDAYPRVTITPVYSNNKGDPVAYSTSSSSASAKQDATSFWSDPMWTLLTTMKIIPRMAQLTQIPHLPREATVAMCGILAMLSMRSPGAAAAIAQHETLIQNVLRRSLLPPDEASVTTDYLNPSTAIPTIILLCTMARQSRAVACAIRFDSIFPPIMAMDSCDPKLCQWALILWRILLRYGLGLQHVQFAVARSVLHLAKARAVDKPLAVEFLTCFANVLDCVKIVKHKNTTSTLISQEDMDVLMNSEGWLISTLRQGVEILGTKMKGATRLQAACLFFLQSYVSIYAPIDNQNQIHPSPFLEEIRSPLLLILNNLSVDGSLTEGSKRFFDDEHFEASDEAASCAFINSFAALCSSLSKLENSTECPTQELLSQMSQVFEEVFSRIRYRTFESDRSRQGWFTQTQFRIVRFLLEATKTDEPSRFTRSLAFDLIGRLEQGDEAQAAIIFSSDNLFVPLSPEVEGPSRLSSMFMGELCTSNYARNQLDHSFKRLRGFGITTQGWGAFALDSLLNEAERVGPTIAAEKLLPLRKLWLWHVLSGGKRDGSTEGENEQGSVILVQCLELLLDLELTNDAYTLSVPTGSKLYYIANLCLAPESILRNDDVSRLSSKLVDYYVRQLDNEVSFGLDMMHACFKHSEISKADIASNVDAENTSKFYDTITGNSSVHAKAIRSFVDFVSDLCTAFIEYGAQYEVFVKCIRILWRPELPSKIRTEILTQLQDVSTLLTLPHEVNSPALIDLAVGFVLNGLPGEEGVKPDSPEILDLVATILKKDKYNDVDQCAQTNLFVLVACCMLSRSLTGAIKYSSSLEPSKRRITGLPYNFATVICGLARVSLTNTASVTSQGLTEHAIVLLGNDSAWKQGAEFSWHSIITDLERIRSAIPDKTLQLCC